MDNVLTNNAKLQSIINEVEMKIRPIHDQIDKIVENNQYRVLKSFQKMKSVIHILFLQRDTAMMILGEIR